MKSDRLISLFFIDEGELEEEFCNPDLNSVISLMELSAATGLD